MRLFEIGNETAFALPEDRETTLFKVGMYEGGGCLVRMPDGTEIPMIGGTVVVGAKSEETQQ